jgi:hypothetical protein
VELLSIIESTSSKNLPLYEPDGGKVLPLLEREFDGPPENLRKNFKKIDKSANFQHLLLKKTTPGINRALSRQRLAE